MSDNTRSIISGETVIPKILKCILITLALCFTAPSDISAQDISIDKVWTETNVYHNGQQGIKVHCSFTVYGMQGAQAECYVALYHANGDAVIKQGNYHNHFASLMFTPPYPTTSYSDFVLFIPHSDLSSNLPYGNYTLQCSVVIGSEFMTDWPMSDFLVFSFNNPQPQQYPQNNSYQKPQSARKPMIEAKFCRGNSAYYLFSKLGKVVHFSANSRDREGMSVIPGTEKYQYGTYYILDQYRGVHITWDNGAEQRFDLRHSGNKSSLNIGGGIIYDECR